MLRVTLIQLEQPENRRPPVVDSGIEKGECRSEDNVKPIGPSMALLVPNPAS
jgi:hypothetical protein